MIKITVAQVRSDTSIPFFADAHPDRIPAITQHMTSTAHIVSFKSEHSQDGLTLTSTLVYTDQAQRDEFRAEWDAVPALVSVIADRNAYNTAHNITSHLSVDSLFTP